MLLITTEHKHKYTLSLSKQNNKHDDSRVNMFAMEIFWAIIV